MGARNYSELDDAKERSTSHHSSKLHNQDQLMKEASKANETVLRADHGLKETILLAMESVKSNGGANAIDREQAIVLLRALPLLQQLGEESLSRIAAVLKTVHYGPGESIVHLNSEGERLYIIWKGEAKVVSPTKAVARGHTVSTLRCGDYFGLASSGSSKQSYKVDVFAINEVTCLLLAHDNADLISGASVWDWSGGPAEGEPALIERILQLDTVEVDLFRSKLPALIKNPRRDPNIFGGQSLGQALLAASRTVDPGYVVHSLHSYFLRTGKEDDPVVYQVQRTRDGMSFATRHVQAIQFGKVIFVMYVSFKRPEDGPAFEHNDHPFPNSPSPEEVIQEEVAYDNFLTDPRLPLSVKQKYAGVRLQLPPIELRQCDPIDKFQVVKMDAWRRTWMKTRTSISDDPVLHRCVAAYVSDIGLLETALRCHPEYTRSRMQMLSLDHSMWFHRPLKADEWFLVEQSGPWTGDGRALSSGRFYQDGELAITVSQEGLIRSIDDKIEKVAKL